MKMMDYHIVFCEREENESCERSTSRKDAIDVHRRFCEKYIHKKLEKQ